MIRRTILAVASVAATLMGPCLSVAGDAKPEELSAVIGPEALQVDRVALSAWLAYVGARIKWREDHHLAVDPEHKIVVAGFQEELEGRKALVDAWNRLTTENPGARDKYIETLGKVTKAGYLPEYVHVYLVPNPDWADMPPESLGQFNDWRVKRLKKHTPATVLKIR